VIFAALLALGAAIGALLGLLGAGGSILAVPGFIAVLGLPMSGASLAGAVVVGSAAAASLLRRRASESIHVRAGLTFSATGLIGTILGARLASIVDDRLITYLFALVVLAAAVSMWRPVNLAGKTRSGAVAMFVIASGVGVLTGLFGIGGGFMIVPALVLGAGLTVREASGASLVAITMNSVIALLLRADEWGALQTGPVATVGVVAIATSVVVAPLANRIPAPTLRRGFALFLVGVALLLIVDTL
jgi:uncharacterized protein